MLGVGVVPFTMESLGAYLFAGAFRFLGAPQLLAGRPADTVFCKTPRGKARKTLINVIVSPPPQLR